MKIAVISPHEKLDAMASVIIEGLNGHGAEIVASDRGNGILDKWVRDDDAFVNFANQADFIFVLWGKGPDAKWNRGMNNKHPKYYLLDRIQRYHQTVYIDGSEWTSTGHPETYDGMRESEYAKNRLLPVQIIESKIDTSRCKGQPWINEEMRKKCAWYFKRECYTEDLVEGILPLNVGCHSRFVGDTKYWHADKPIDIFCSFGQTYTGLRYEVEKVCRKIQSEGEYNVKILSGEKISHDEYLKTISQSKISVSAWGAGNSCMRMWESMANGSCCFIQRPEILFLNKPSDGFHCVEYSTPDEFERKIRKYLKNEPLCRIIGLQGQELTLDYHTGIARVQYILDIIQDTNGWRSHIFNHG